MYDGVGCRSGGPKRANDARGTKRHNNCRLYDHGHLCVRPFAEVPALDAKASAARRAKSELLYSYGEGYWELHEELLKKGVHG